MPLDTPARWTAEQRRNAATKTCALCGEAKPLEEFYKDGQSGDGYRSRCAVCVREQRRQFRAEHGERLNAARRQKRAEDPVGVNARQREWKYGLGPGRLEEMLASQGGCCASCGRGEHGGKGWHIDHDHSCCPGAARSCGACVRGILCHPCNLMLGQAKDDPQVLRRGIEYLERWHQARAA